MDKVFIDSDIILDLIQEREPFFGDAIALFSLIESKKVYGFVSPLILANLFYILRKSDSKSFAINVLLRLKTMLRVLPIDEKVIQLALTSTFKDFEEAVQYYTAVEARLGYLITRNKSDYRETGLVVCSAKEFLSMFETNDRIHGKEL